MKNPYFYTTVGVGGVEFANDVLNESEPIPTTQYGTIFSLMKNINEKYVLPKLIEIETNKDKKSKWNFN